MLVPFEELPNHSRVWIYQSNREFFSEELEILKSETSKFLTQWTAHGNNLKAGFDVKFNHFLVIGLDEGVASASGCSIDSSVHFVTELGQKINIDFFNRTMVAFLIDEQVSLQELNNIKSGNSDIDIHPGTITFNNLVPDKKEFETNWQVPVSESWINRLLAGVDH